MCKCNGCVFWETFCCPLATAHVVCMLHLLEDGANFTLHPGSSDPAICVGGGE